MDFPVTDVVKNIRYFLSVVKRATGNARDPLADDKEKGQKPSEWKQLFSVPHTFGSHDLQRMPSLVSC